MDGAVPSLFSKPIFTRISLQSRLTSIAVDNQISGLKGQYYDILFMGTGNITLIYNISQYILYYTYIILRMYYI